VNAAALHQAEHRKRRSRLILLGLTVILVALIARGLFLWRSEPAHWQEHRNFLQTTPREQINLLANSVQLRAPSEWSRPIGNGDGLRTLSFTFDEINAWLAVRLDEWLANQNASRPEGVGDTMLSQREGQLVIAFDYTSENVQGIISVFLDITHHNDTAHLGISHVTNGRLPLPKSAVLNAIRDSKAIKDDPESAQILNALAQEGHVGPLLLPIGDGNRQAQLLDLTVRPEGFDIKVHVHFIDPPR